LDAYAARNGQPDTLTERRDGHDTAQPAAVHPCLSPCVNDNNVMALQSPFATVMWDYINRGMPIGKEGTLLPDDVYSLTAFLLYKNGVIGEDDILDARSLPDVVMPNRNGFALPPEEWRARPFA
jgi:hypothetical protein